MNSILPQLESFASEFGLSEHRVGMLLANNGRLIERLRDGGRIWPDTEAAILDRLRVETEVRRSSKRVEAS